MMIEVKEALSTKEKLDFIKFPFSLYKNNPYWVPPLIQDELDTFDIAQNPVFETAEAHFYIAYQNQKIVGRIAAIINWDEVNTQQKKKVRFGWFETIDNIEVTKALLGKVYELGKKHQLEYTEGPMGFSNLDKVGVLTEGFDKIGTMITWYNPPYYAKHFEQLGFTVEKKYTESSFNFNNVQPDFFLKANDLIIQRYGLRPLNFTKTKDVMPYADKMFDLFNLTYSKLSSFTPINEKQKAYFKKKYISFINPEYIKYIEDQEGRLVSFAIVMPDFAQALQKANGKLFPFGFYHLMKAKKSGTSVVFYLIGIHPDYQNKGITAVIFNEYYHLFKDTLVKNFIRTPELEENTAIQNMWKHFDPKIDKRRCTYRKEL